MADTGGFWQNVSSNPAVFMTVSTAGQQLLDSIAVFIVAPHYLTTLYVTENNSLYNETQLSPFSRAKPNQHPMPYATD